MAVTATAPRLTAADLKEVGKRVKSLIARGVASTFVSVTTEDGEIVITVFDKSEESVLFGIGKEHGWYYLFHADGVPVAQSRNIDEVFRALPRD